MSNVDISSGEKVVYSGDASDGDIAIFQNEIQREIDLKQAMEGPQMSEGGRHDNHMRGITSETQEQLEQGIIDSGEFNHLQYDPSPTFTPSNIPNIDQRRTDANDYKQLYGQSENEKGELRRNMAQLMEANKQLLAQMQYMSSNGAPATPQFFNQSAQHNPTSAPNYNQPATQYTPRYDINNIPRLVDKANDEMMLAGETDELLRTKVAPFVIHSANVAEQALFQAAQAREQLFNMQKAQLGLTPEVEMQLVMRNPWLRTFNDPSAYLNAASSILANEKALANVNKTNGNLPNVNTPSATPQRVVRRISYVEGANPSSAERTGQASREAQFQASWNEVLVKYPYGHPERTRMQKELLRQYGVNEYSGYRDPSVTTR